MEKITVTTTIKANLEKVWAYWTQPEHIIQWNFAAEEWCCPRATNELQSGGSFNWRMESKDGKMGFDFVGTYDKIIENELITYKMPDGRQVDITFESTGEEVIVKEIFDPEQINPIDLQRNGWQAILENFKKHVESAV
ncbi:MAG: SRPBCC family protein [Bacteroidetes bacterium]|nr:SRPBCC family protein [Bacteroidota bacterium]